ncbi:hypothetical protein FBUS_01116 [Fasciolopsis buskii]|uniref:Uncharacterized protein n=1 Tax=Fasciolopsis buskii TaxID=27845 RepID=A0A8E0VFU9_9TREM|nr:hypothetical protein FBUS_01116 [Fasciolopsis buski]
MSYSLQPAGSHSSGKDANSPPSRNGSKENNTTSAMNGALTHAQLTSFNAYPLEYSTNFLKPDNEVLFIPITPTDLPLTLPESSSCVQQSQTMNPQIHRQPLCHGFFFPQSSSHTSIGYPVQKTEASGTHGGVSTSSSCTNPVNEHPNFGADATGQLQLLLLQQLIHLQLEKQRLNGDEKETQPNVFYPPYSLPLEVPPAYPPTTMGTSLPSSIQNHSDLCTYIMPVEAQIHEDKGLSLHITPRAENFGSDSLTHNPSVTMECPSEQLVLYPYTPQRNTAECFSDNEESAFENNSMPPAQTFTMDDLHQFIRRGSIEKRSEANDEIVNSMKSCAKSGFVLLSVRHERINQDERQPYISKPTPTPVVTQPTNDVQAVSHVDAKGNYTENRSSRRLGKKKIKNQKSDPEHRRRPSRKYPRTPLKTMQETEVQTSGGVDLAEDESKTTASVSRFRVTRFADKHQAWLAPSHSGCFVVHDLWTTKLPDYVIKSMEQIETHKFSLKDITEAHEVPPLTICAVCQSNQRKYYRFCADLFVSETTAA